ncbi:TetR/AcrR family transcriptional regulator [Methylosinus sp. Sm6]|uniref:TetR/AcrR family transcriptional regulator n=1 Tax=Methylosinus sp. Sm6 TaxID=2866948 RepID=UPI001C9A0669|nr:TetR/AcrR family transcriptional regulator [Methylosinus sp. Sm6]MBY6240170.1 TetR/AcrR family transcriptional regulator [Methylosinus sp. Sm6]
MTRETKSARDRILETAHDLFYRDGVRATGVDRLIAEAGVTKVTFYRHFPSKDDLIRAFLEHRHERWMRWFEAALARHAEGQSEAERRQEPLAPLVLALADWFAQPSYRGCAFINSVAEIGDALPDVAKIASRHKGALTKAILSLLPDDAPDRMVVAYAARLAADGAIVGAQAENRESDEIIAALRLVSRALTSARSEPLGGRSRD